MRHLQVLLILAASAGYGAAPVAEIFRDDFTRYPAGWLSYPVGVLNAAIQEYHYLPHRGVPLGPWAACVCHLDAWAVGEEDGRRYLEQHLTKSAPVFANPIFITGDPEWSNYTVGQCAAPQSCILRDGFLSYRQFLERPVSLERSYALFADREKEASSEKEIPFHLVPHAALERCDMAATLSSVKASGFVVDPLDGDWQPVPVSRSRYRVLSQVHPASWDEYGSQPERLVQAPRSEP